MEAFFDQESTPRYWGSSHATITQIACSTSQWPPVIAAAGYAPCIRAWEPTRRGQRIKGPSSKALTEVQFNPVDSLREMDANCFVTCVMHGDMLVGATAGPNAKVIIWDTISWARLAVLQPGCTVACLAVTDTHVAVGSAAGAVHVWRHVTDQDWQPLFSTPLQLDQLPIHNVAITRVKDNELLVVHSKGKNAVGVWRLADGKLVHRLEMRTTGDDLAPVVAANMEFMCVDGPLLAGVSYLPGHDPVVQLVDVVSRDGELVEAPDRLQGRGKPLAADFDGALLAVGCEDGAVMVFGYRGWLRWHKGAVGAVKVLSKRMQVLSGCAGGEVCLWDVEGKLVSSVQMGFQVTSLTGGDVFAVVGGAEGQVQVLILPPADPPTQPTEAPEVDTSNQPEAQRPDQQTQPYKLWFDLRPAAHVHPAVKSQNLMVGCLSELTPPQAALVRCCFQKGKARVDVQHFQTLHQQAARDQALQAAGDAAGQDTSKVSGFNAKAALAGSALTKEDEEKVMEGAKKQQLAQMGEAAGVARAAKAVLASSVEHLGRKCDNPSCLVREAASKTKGFSRCGSCRQVYYCSVHCQRTHWRDGHNTQCKQLQQAQAAAAAAQATSTSPVKTTVDQGVTCM